MYARSTTIVGDPSRIDDAITQIRDEAWPAIQDMDGFLGISMVVDRESGRVIVTGAWETEQALSESRAKVLVLRDKTQRLMGGGAPVVEEWEIASMHRRHDAPPETYLRAAWSRVPHTHIKQALDYYKSTLLPQIEKLEGFVSASLMVDRATGRGVTSVAYESREALERTREQAHYLREASTNEANVETLDVGEFELVLAHLHVPEV